MKNPPNQSASVATILGATAIAAGFVLLCSVGAMAQSAAQPVSLVSVAALSQNLSEVASTAVPRRGGTYWWVLEGGSAVPAPCLPPDFNGPIFQISSNNEFLLDISGGEVNPRRFGLPAIATGATDATVAAAANDQIQSLVELITWVQAVTANQKTLAPETTMSLLAKPMGGGGFGPLDPSQIGYPYLTIAPTGTNQLLITVMNTNPAIYYLQMTPVLGNTNYPFAIIANGVAGQTNFPVIIGPFADKFFRVLMATNDPGQGIAVFIDSPANGSTVQ